MNQQLLHLAQWIESLSWSTALHESYYMYNWIESTHVLSLSLFLGMLFFIDLRMLGLAMTNVPASTIAARLHTPMMIGFLVMIVTGLLLYFAVPVRVTQSIWFRIKFVLLVLAGINAWYFNNKMKKSATSWEEQERAPKSLRVSVTLSLTLWAGVITTGRLIAYDWYDCYRVQSEFIAWAAGCMAE
jgi:uncharacterized membrane protein